MTGPINITGDETEIVTVQVTDEISVLTVQVPGVPGPKGDKGDQGIQGATGPQGIKGDQGIQGIQGVKGDTGLTGPANTLALGTTVTGAAGSSAAVSITGTSPNQTLTFTIPRGNTGLTGPANTLAIGTVTTLAPGASATATITGTAPNQTLNLSVPQGATGATGPANTLTIGTVTTVANGTPAAASISGTAPNQTLSLTLPAGVQGVKGDQGIQGVKGDTGLTGPANTLAIGTVTTGGAGSSAVATITGTAPNQTLNLTIPTGLQGPAGSGAPDATSTANGSVRLTGDFGGTAASPTVISGTHHTHTSAQISDASSATAVNTLVLRNSVGEARIGRMYTENTTPNTTDEYTAKAYVDAQVATKVAIAGDLGGTAAAPTVTGGTHHTHTASQISDSTTVGQSLIKAADAATARTAIGAGTSSLVLGTTSTTALAGNYAPPIDGAAGTGTMRTLGTGSTQAAAGNHTHAKADIGLGNVDNTADTAKPVSTAQKTYIDAADTSLGNRITTLEGYNKILVLTSAASVPAGTPANTIIFRTS